MQVKRARMATLPAALAAIFAATSPAWAHHGWAWAEGEVTQLTGVIRSVEISPPHPVLEVEAEDGTVWTIELGNPGRTERAGFVDGVAEAGDAVTITGNQSRDQNEKLMKAVAIALDGKNYVFYPERMPES